MTMESGDSPDSELSVQIQTPRIQSRHQAGKPLNRVTHCFFTPTQAQGNIQRTPIQIPNLKKLDRAQTFVGFASGNCLQAA